jgi:hypothetical protein
MSHSKKRRRNVDERGRHGNRNISTLGISSTGEQYSHLFLLPESRTNEEASRCSFTVRCRVCILCMLVSKTLSLYHLALSQIPHSRHVDTSAYSSIVMYTKKNNHELWLSSPPVPPNTKTTVPTTD